MYKSHGGRSTAVNRTTEGVLQRCHAFGAAAALTVLLGTTVAHGAIIKDARTGAQVQIEQAGLSVCIMRPVELFEKEACGDAQPIPLGDPSEPEFLVADLRTSETFGILVGMSTQAPEPIPMTRTQSFAESFVTGMKNTGVRFLANAHGTDHERLVINNHHVLRIHIEGTFDGGDTAILYVVFDGATASRDLIMFRFETARAQLPAIEALSNTVMATLKWRPGREPVQWEKDRTPAQAFANRIGRLVGSLVGAVLGLLLGIRWVFPRVRRWNERRAKG